MSDNSTKKAPGTGVRVLLRILSIGLCLLLTVSLLATALVLDVQLLTGKNGMSAMIDSVLCAPPQTRRSLPMTASIGAAAAAQAEDRDSPIQDALIDWLYDAVQTDYGKPLPFTEEQIQTFLEQSTLKDYLGEKAASYAEDFLNGTSNTTITAQEISQLIEDNKALIESTFGITVTPKLEDQIISYVEGAGIDRVIHEEIIKGLQDLTIPGGSPLFPENAPDPDNDPATENGMINSSLGGTYTVGALMADLKTLTSVPVLIVCIIVDLVLIAALFFVNRMRIVSTLVCTGISAAVSGALLSVPLAVAQLGSGLLASLTGPLLTDIIQAGAGVLAPIHYGCLVLGVVLIAAGIITAATRKKKA